MAAPVDDIKDINRFGLSEVYPRTNAPTNVDIVFVHGLNGDPHRTWTSEQTKVFWPAQLLPPLLEEENARVLVYGYDSEVTSFTDGVSKDKIHNHAESLVAALAANRRLRKATERPIIFVAHSLGGLVVKRGLIYSSEIRGPKTEHLRSIFVSTYGILFLGTPHKGSDVAQWGSRLEWICNAVMPKKIIDTQPQLVEALKTNNETLQNIDRQFIQLMSRFYIYFFHEAKPTNLKGTFRFIVEEDSASPNVQDVERAGIQADHSHMCKFESDSSPGFDLVAEGIQRYAEEAPAIIKTRWIQERKASEAQKQAAVEEIIPGFGSMSGPAKGTPDSGSSEFATLGNSLEDLPLSESTLLRNAQHTTNAADAIELPSKLAEPYFIVPPGFRPNTFFVGMDRELKELDRRLFDGRRRSEGTACVLIHGQPGAGKSHLARQYVNKNRKKFDGGIFWINARLREEIYQAYWNIAQKVVLRDSPHLRLTADGNERSFEDIVKTWFEARRQWLIVFDGIAVDKDDDAAELQSFIPDSEDSSIIYVSRASNLGTKQRLLRPFPIKVHALKEDDARKLIFKELHIKKPTEAEVKSAAELVKKMGGLPLAIHAISHRLGDTHEPLTKYNMKSYSADPKLGATYNGIMDDLQRLGHQGAWNLINLICFYGPHLPVELIRIGIKVLRHSDIEVKSSENGEKPDLNTTFGVLMRYALIERNEPDEGDSASSSRDSLIGPEPIDMLKMHSVAQKFCCDALNAATILPQWLGYAVDVFCESFRQADGKIKAKPQAGRVSDYREYLVHGKRLLDHSKGYETKTQNLKAIREKLQLRLSRISEEIETRQPGSSQESVRGQEFQVSIFDRTSSTSDSAASEHEVYTPNNRPYPLSTHESLYGGDLFKEHVETPTSMHSNSPSGPIRIVDNSPRAPFLQLLDDEQYDTDRDEPLRSHPMHHNVSDATARPRAPSTVSQDEGWQTVPPSRRTARARDHQAAPKFPNYGRPRPHRDLGSFRPTPARAELAGVSNVDAVGSFSQPRGERLGNLSGSSDAVTSLSAVHHSSPPPSRGGRSISQQRSPSRPPAPAPTQPTYAGIVAGQPHRPVSSQQEGLATGVSGVPGPYPSAPVLSAMQRGRSRESLQGRAGNLQPSPLAAEFRPHENITQSASNENSPFVPPLVYQGSAHTTPDRSPGLHYVNATPGSNFSLSRLPYGSSDENNAPHFQGPVVAGPNPADLPLEENISITPKRRAPADFRDHYPPFDLKCYHTPPSHQAAPLTFDPYQVPYDSSYYASYYRSPLPAGWGSQPMTRANSSRQSHSSVAATDPILYNSSISPRFSPYISGLDLCPRDRNADGRPPSKSPKHYHAFPVPTDQSPQPGQAREYTLSGTGGWAGSPKASPTSQAYDAAAASMSRTGSGPGVAVGEPGQMEIAEFGGQFVGGGQVQFGAHPPVVFEEGRSRVREWERRLRESERGGREEGASRRVGRSAPYPSRNRIPTEGEDVVMGEVGGGARTRGVSAPGEGRGGLGLGIGMEFQL